MSYPQLIEKCAKAIAENRCVGCQTLEDTNFVGNPNCIYSKIPTSQESIKQIKSAEWRKDENRYI